MYGNPAQPQPGGFDWYDFWQLVSLVGTGLSVVAAFTGGREARQLGQLGTVLGAGSTAAQLAVAPPRCGRCQRRMNRPPQPYAGGPQWLCSCGNMLYPAS